MTTLSNNKASECGALCIANNSCITFKGASAVMFTKNTAIYSAGAVSIVQNSNIIFKGNCRVVFNHNHVKEMGGAISLFTNSFAAFIENSNVTFYNNTAQKGGAIYLSLQSNFTTDNYSSVIFSNNAAVSGGSLFATNHGIAKFNGNTVIQFSTNRASYGGAIMFRNATVVMFREHAKVTFKENMARVVGGALYSVMTSDLFFTQYSTVTFYNNSAKFDEIIYTKYGSPVTITTNSTVKFNNNTARWYGGIPYSHKYGYSDIAFNGNGTVTCSDPETLLVCIHQNCFCEVIDSVLASLTSNVQIDLSANMTLPTIISLSDLNNISMIGYHNPTINCNNNGGIKFTFCHNCTIKGITWDSCGAENINDSSTTVVEFHHSTSITIQNCTFQHSIGQAVVMLQVSGTVKIYHCQFLRNKNYKGHGTAIYFSPSNNFKKNIKFLLQLVTASLVIMDGLKVSFVFISIITNFNYIF